MKKQVSLLFAALLLLTAAAAHAVSGDAGNGYTYTIENDVLILSGSGPMKDYGKFTDTAPWTLQPIRAAVFPAGVTHIGKWTIHENTMLQTIVFLGTTAPELDDDWVYDPHYSTPKNVVVPQGSEGNFTSTFDPAEFTIVPAGGMDKNNYVDWSLDLTTGVLTLDTPLEGEEVYVSGYSKKGDAPWYACAPCIKRVEVSEFVASIDSYAFAGCYNLTSVKFESQTSLADDTFDDAPLSAIEIRLEDYEFYSGSEYTWWYSNKEKFTCWNYVISGTDGNVSWDFDPVEATLTLSGKGAMKNYNYDWDYTYTEDNLTTAPWASLYDKIEKVVINEGITSVGSYAFLGLKELTSVEFPVSLTSIGDGAFESCVGLESLNLPVGLQAIGNAAFSKCSSVSTMNIPAGVTELSYLFSGLDYAFSMTLTCYGTTPPVLTGGFPEYVFVDYTKLIVPYGCTAAYEAAGYGYYFTTIEEMAAPASGTDGNIKWTLDPGTGELLIEKDPGATAGTMEDYDITHLYSMPWSEDNTGIASNSINRITVASGVTSIGEGAFLEFGNVQMVTLPEGLTSIGAAAFGGCISLKSVTLPSTLTSLGYQVFLGCSSLLSVSIPAGLTTLPPYAFQVCTSLTEVNLNNVTVIERYAFEGCSALKHTGSLEKVQEIRESAFYGCSSLETVELCDIRAIYEQAFDGCSSLKHIDIFSKTPCDIAPETVFDGCPSSLQIRVPEQSVEDYMTTWGENYQDMITYLPYLFYARWKTTGSTEWTYIEPTLEFLMNPVLTIDDSNCDAFEVVDEFPMGTVVYERTFKNTNWQSLYMPFNMKVSDFGDDFEVAYVNNFKQYDMDGDGVIDKSSVEMIKITKGTLHANYPYVIRAKTASNSPQTITFTDVTMIPATPSTVYKPECSSIVSSALFFGTFEVIPKAVAVPEGYLVMSGGSWITNSGNIKAFRTYMKLTSKDPAFILDPSATIEIRLVGEDDETTTVEDMMDTECVPDIIYDLTGRKVENPSNGIYVVGGKKVFVK